MEFQTLMDRSLTPAYRPLKTPGVLMVWLLTRGHRSLKALGAVVGLAGSVVMHGQHTERRDQ